MAYLELRNIHKSYYLGKEEFPVLKGIDLTFDRGDFVSILGESGGGKSTLMNIIGGLDRNFEGEVTINGQLLDHKKEKQLDLYRRGTIGYIYQSYNLISHLSVLDNVLVALDMTKLNRNERTKRATDLLARVGLSDQIKKHPNQLSGGQKQRVAIARALAADPDIIIADEPTGALDSVNTAEVLDILNQIAQDGKLVITVTHSQEVADAGTRIVHLVDGKVSGDERIKPTYPMPQDTESLPSKPLSAMASFQNAFSHLTYNFGRNFLIILGTAIGLFAVMLFLGLGTGIKGYINQQVTALANPNYPTVFRNTSKDNQLDSGQRLQATMQSMRTNYSAAVLTDDYIQKLKDTTHVTQVQPAYNFSNTRVSAGKTQATIPSYQSWTDVYTSSTIKAGSKPKKGEILVDKKTFAELYNKHDWKAIIGKTVSVTFAAMNTENQPVQVTQQLKVSGVVDGGTFIGNYATMKADLTTAKANAAPNFATVEIDKTENVKATVKKLNGLKQNGMHMFAATSIGDVLDTVNTITSLATTVLAAIAGISLVVSALMIIVTMFMSVSERTKEIGILRALGESKRDIRRLFTSESIFLGLFAGVLGTAMAYGIGALLNAALYKIASYNMIAISWQNVLTAFVLALLISFLAALLPARRASRLNPIDALAAD